MLWIVYRAGTRCIWGAGDRCQSGGGGMEEGVVLVKTHGSDQEGKTTIG
jgi:hypothetical protein